MQKGLIVFVSWFMFIVGTFLMVLAIAAPHWRGSHDFHEGIFQRCTDTRCDALIFYDGKEPELDLIRMLMLIGLFYILISSVLGLYSMITVDVQTCLRALAFLHVVIGLSLYTYRYADKHVEWSFTVAWSGISVYAVGFMLIFYSGCLPDNRKEELYYDYDYY